MENTTSTQTVEQLISAFLTSDPEPRTFLNLLEQSGATKVPVVHAILSLQKASLGLHSLELAIKEVEKIAQTKSESIVSLALLLAWLRLLLLADADPKRTKELVYRLLSLMDSNTPAELRGWAMFMQAGQEFQSGNIARFKTLLTNCTQGISQRSPHFKRLKFLASTADFLLGLGPRAELFSTQAGDLGSIYGDRLVTMRFIDCMMRFDSDAAQRHLETLEQYTGPEIKIWTQHLSVARDLLTLMEEEGVQTQPFTKVRTMFTKLFGARESLWLRSTRCLLRNQLSQALELAKQYEEEASTRARTVIGFDDYALIRAELANRNGAAAFHLLELRRSIGAEHYFDSFFLARAQLLLGAEDAAQTHYDNLLSAVDSYEAGGRLRFELRLAHELSPAAVSRLSRGRKVSAGQKVTLEG